MKARPIISMGITLAIWTSALLGGGPLIVSLQADSNTNRVLGPSSGSTSGPTALQSSARLQGVQLGIHTNALDPSLVVWLSFDNDFSQGPVLDMSGHGADAYNLNPTNPVVPIAGKFGQAGYWGSHYAMGEYSLGPYLAITNYRSFEFLTNGTISVWAWASTNSGQTTALVDAGYPTMTNSWSLRRYYDTAFEFTIWTNGSFNDTYLLRFPADIVGYPNYATASWHHYCVTWQGSGPALAYYDGAPIATNNLPVPYLQVGSLRHWVAIGCWTHNNSYLPDGTGPNNGWMGGLMDDIRIYNRALSGVEVQKLCTGSQ